MGLVLQGRGLSFPALISKSGFEGGILCSKDAEYVRRYNVRLGLLPVPFAKVRLFRDGRLVAESQANMFGVAEFRFDIDEVGVVNYVATLLDDPSDPLGLLTDKFKLGVWNITVSVTRVSDISPRYVGRSVNESLPRQFWKQGKYVVGLMMSWNAVYNELFPTDDKSKRYVEYGVSSPGHRFCEPGWGCFDGWYLFDVTATNGLVVKKFATRLRGDMRLRIQVNAGDVNFMVRQAQS